MHVLYAYSLLPVSNVVLLCYIILAIAPVFAGHLPTAFRCIGTAANDRICLYRNLYYTCTHQFVALSPTEDVLPVIVCPKRETIFKPMTTSRMNDPQLKEGLYFFFNPLAPANIGHALFDGLYPIFLSAMTFGLEEENFTVLTGMPEHAFGDGDSLSVYEWFSGGKVMFVRDMEVECKRNSAQAWRFDRVLAGSGDVGNMIPTYELATKGSLPPIWGTRHFRNRMFIRHGIGPYAPSAGSPVRIIFIDNKRHSSTDIQLMKQLIEELRDIGMSADYVDWSQVGQGKDRFRYHLQVLRETDVYISGPGTGIIIAPFLRDGRVVINMGSLMSRGGMTFPLYMEQELVGGGTPYLRVLYTTPRRINIDPPGAMPVTSLDLEALRNQTQYAITLVKEGFLIPVPTEENLSPVGKALRELCLGSWRKNDTSCTTLIDDLRHGPLIRPEMVVLGLGCRSTKHTHQQLCLRSSRLSTLKLKHGVVDAWESNSTSMMGS